MEVRVVVEHRLGCTTLNSSRRGTLAQITCTESVMEYPMGWMLNYSKDLTHFVTPVRSVG